MSTSGDTIQPYKVREVVARFEDATKFEDAVEAVERAGIDRSRISMMASHDAVEKKLGHLYIKSSELEEDGTVPQAIFASRHDLAEGKAAAIGVPAYIGGAGAGLAVVASGGTLAFAALIAAAGGAAGAGIGSLLAHALSKHHADVLEQQLALGGLLVWVEVENKEEEEKILDVLKKAGGEDIHAHSITRYWGDQDVPLHDFNPDPFLEREPL